MGREARIQAADTVYHLTARGIRRLRVYEDAIDYRKFESLLSKVVGERGWAVHSYCQMPNHYHLLLNTPEPDISDGMYWLNGVYARWFNERHGYSGHVFEARFFSEIIKTNVHLLNLACYIPNNPVRAKLCAHAAEWPWSSFGATIGRASKPWLACDWLRAQFGRDRVSAALEYERYVARRVSL